ncbi:HAD-IA family hydrolase [Streptomyces sp. NPDC051940]|uniref:HAD-IA family hydrolase n=1 Tax=Streptomyces sp. NPDC051940 TaxID=3155675 RepID=UPI003442D87D
MKITADALLFDMDGTLVSSMESVLRCWNRWAAEYAVPAEVWTGVELHGRPDREIIAGLLPPDRVDEAVERLTDLELQDVAGGVVLLPGTRELLERLPPGRWAVVTSAGRALAQARLREVGIHAPLVVGADDVRRGKPDPEPYLTAARRLGAPPERCVVLEDAPAGLAAGRAAGMTTVALTTTHPAAELSADVVVPDLSAVSAQAVAGGVEITTS